MAFFLGFMAIFSRLFPASASRLALRMMTTPRPGSAMRGDDVVAGKMEQTMPVGSRACLRVCPGGPRRVLLVHGWSGHGKQFQPLMNALGHEQYSFYVLQMPGHGAEADGTAHVGDFITTVRQALDVMGEPVDLVIGHSMGAAALAYVLAERPEIRRAVLVSTPADFHAVVGRMASFLRFGRRARQQLLDGMAGRVGMGYEVLDIARRGRHIQGEVLLIHDVQDREVPFTDTLRLHQALPAARLLQTHGLGHRRLLSESSVHEAVQAFAGEPTVKVSA
tara:strand:- start:391 stop:1224 length:834 start_codon:yes stop_codon:yes gene_type:complete